MKEQTPKYIHVARVNAIIDALKRGAKNGELDAAANLAEKNITDVRGVESEENFKRISRKISQIKEILPGTDREDREYHTDFWIVLQKPISGRRMLPVEIKSSDPRVREVKNSKDFKRNGLLIVLNSNKKRTDHEIIGDFQNELERVTHLLFSLSKKRP